MRGAAPALAAAIPAKTLAVRVHLPAKGCTVEDAYRAPEVTGGKVLFYARSGVLTTQVSTAKVAVGVKEESQWLLREIVVNAEGGGK